MLGRDLFNDGSLVVYIAKYIHTQGGSEYFDSLIPVLFVFPTPQCGCIGVYTWYVFGEKSPAECVGWW